MAAYTDKLLDHEYDGIHELDNSLPRWWLWLMYVTIAFSVVYMTYYHVLEIGYLSADEYRREVDPNYFRPGDFRPKYFGLLPQYNSPYYNPERDMADEAKRRAASAGFVMETRETDTVTYIALTDQASLSAGQDIFKKNCVSCHGQQAQGDIGPNLTDKYWLHGAGMSNVVLSVKYGYPAKGMISWRGFLKKDQILQVASYVLTLQGTNPPNPKPPQGDLVGAAETAQPAPTN